MTERRIAAGVVALVVAGALAFWCAGCREVECSEGDDDTSCEVVCP